MNSIVKNNFRYVKNLFLLAIFITAPSCNQGDQTFHFSKVNRQESTYKCGKDLDQEIKDSKIFAENFINEYQKYLKQEVQPTFLDSFYIANTDKISARFIFSSDKEAFINLSKSDKNQLDVDCTIYPIQMVLLTGIDTKGTKLQIKVSRDSLLSLYDYQKVMFNFGEHSKTFFENLTLSTSNFKLFSIGKNSIITLINVGFKFTNGSHYRRLSLDGISFLTGNNNFNFALRDTAFKELGKYFAQSKIESYYAKSKIFKEAQDYEKLKPDVSDILIKLQRKQKDYSYNYPHWQFKADYQKLYNKAIKEGISPKVIDNIFNDLSGSSTNGVLFFYYSNYREFILQWIAVNIILLVLIIVFKVLIRFKVSGYNFLKGKITPISVVLSVNGYIFLQRPKYLALGYYWIPGILFMLLIFVSLYEKSNSRKSNSITSK